MATTRRPHRFVREQVRATYRRGPRSLLNLSAYAFGISAVWTAVGSVILQYRVLDISGEESKNTYLGMIALAGLVVAAVVQPISGAVSDKLASSWGKRLPYIVAGNLGLALTAPFLAIADSIETLLLTVCVMQVFGNASQGPANALLTDHIPSDARGAGSGALNLARTAGAGAVVVLVLVLMGNYEQGAEWWLWLSLSIPIFILLMTTAWTFGALKPRRPMLNLTLGPVSRLAEPPPSGQEQEPRRSSFHWLLTAMAMVVASLSAMQLYALYFVRDKVGLENAAHGTALLVVVVGLTTALTVYPFGKLSDRVGRTPPLYAATALVGSGALMLLVIESMLGLLLVGALVGLGTSLFLSSAWALLTEVVPEKSAARSMGMTGLATLAGSGLARVAGYPIDVLNAEAPNLGYNVMLAAIVLLLLLATIPLSIAGRNRGPTAGTGQTFGQGQASSPSRI
ncbi:MAG: MFS transporter [Chloroflexota bacterium]